MRSVRVQKFELGLITSETHDYISFEISELKIIEQCFQKLFCDMPKPSNI